MGNFLDLFDRDEIFFKDDIQQKEKSLKEIISNSSFLVIGAAGSIGNSVSLQIINRNPKKVDLVDINENELTETIRQIRNLDKPISSELNIIVADYGSKYFLQSLNSKKYDYVLNLSALKHVRSEGYITSIKRMFDVNIEYNLKLLETLDGNIKKFFCVSTDKATNPINLMGASKRIMELLVSSLSKGNKYSSARFANVAFSNGSLLQSFQNRMNLLQPIACPSLIKRYFISQKEAGELCMLSTIFGEEGEIYIPKLKNSDQYLLSTLAKKYIENQGFKPFICNTETQAKKNINLVKEKNGLSFFQNQIQLEKNTKKSFLKKVKMWIQAVMIIFQ